MGNRKKKRMGKAARFARQSEGAAKQQQQFDKCPHSFVFHRGHVGRSIIDLVSDMRRVMEPFTASNLKVRQRNTLKDLVSVAGPLNVTHFLCYTHPFDDAGGAGPSTANLRVARLPRGPTLTFHVESYVLSRDVVSAQRRPNTEVRQYRHHPLLVMNGFGGGGGGGGGHLKMLVTMFQNMFPSINVNTAKLNDIRRCILINYDAETNMIDFRHYNVRAAPVGMSRGVKKLVRSRVPDLGGFNDISDFLTKGGNLSESEAEPDGPHNEVILPQEMSSRGNIKSAKSALRLTEVGPRMTLQLVKIEAGMCSGDVLHHEFVEKSTDELKKLKEKRLQKQKLKADRTQKQKDNVRRKEEQKEEHREKSLKGMKAKQDEVEADEFEVVAEEKTDREYYEEEVGEKPEPGMFAAASRPGKRKAAPSADRAGKRPRYSGNKTTPSAGRSEKRPRYSGNKTTPSAGRSEKRPERTRGGETSRASKHAKGGFTGRKAPPGGAGKRWEKRTASGQQDKDGGRRQEKRKPQTEMEKIAKYKLKKKKLAAKKALRRPKGRKQR